MKEGEPKEHDGPASERTRRPSAHSGTKAGIGEELGKLETDALLEGLFGEDTGSAPPPAAERPSFTQVPVKPSSIPPAPSQAPPSYGDEEPTSVFWRGNPSSEPPPSSSSPPSSGEAPRSSSISPERLPFESTPAPENLEPESFLPPPDDDVERAFARVSSPAPRDPEEAERTVRRSLGPFESLSPPELEESERTARRSSLDPKELAALRHAAQSVRAVAKIPSQPPEPLEVERTVRRSVEPVSSLPSQPPEADEAERTVRRSLGSLSPTLPPQRSATRTSAAPPLLEDSSAGLDPFSTAAWAKRAEWLESEAHATANQDAKARALVVASELWALAGDVTRGREVAIEAASIGRAGGLGDRQLRWLAALEGDFESVVTALEAEQLGASTPEARAHAAYLAAEVTRLVQNDDEIARQRHELAARTHPEDPRSVLMRLAEQLAQSSAPPKLKWAERADLAELARATDELSRLRSPVGAAPGTPLGAFEEARQALAVGERGHAANAVLELTRLDGAGSAPFWLAAALLAADERTRPESLSLFERLIGAGAPSARRALALHASSAGDSAALERALGTGADALDAEDRLALGLLAGSRGPELERALGELFAVPSARTLVSAAILAGDTDTYTELPLPVSAERDALVLGRALARDPGAAGGDADAVARALDAFTATNRDEPLGPMLSLELALLRSDHAQIADALGAWTAPEGDGTALAERELARAFVLALGELEERSKEAYERALDLDPACEPAVRALLPEVSRTLGTELLLRLAETETQGARAAVHFLEAALIAQDRDEEVFEPALERAKEADPSLFLSYLLGEEHARKKSDLERRLGWLRARRQQLDEPGELTLAMVREALLGADTDLDAAAALLKEAFDTAPDVSLLDQYTRIAPKDEPGRGALWELVAARHTGPLGAELSLVAALEYERDNDRSAAYRAAERARPEALDELARVLAERLAHASDGAEVLAESLRARLARSTDRAERRDLCERLAELEEARGDRAAALGWLRNSVEHDPSSLAALSALERAALDAGDREPLGVLEARLARLLSGADAAAAAELAVRFHAPESSPETPLALAELAIQQRPDALWALRMLAADLSVPRELSLTAYRELATLATRPLDRATLSLRAAEAAAQAGQHSDARVLLDQALDEVPDHLVALLTLAEVLERAGDPAEAARAYEAVAEASRIDAHKALAFQRAAVLWLDQANDPDRGLSALEQATSIDITQEEAVLRLQSLYVTRGERHKLAELLARRVESSTDTEARMALEVARSRVLSEVGEHVSAKAALSAALDAQPDHQEALQAFAELCLQEGDWNSAEQALLRLARHTNAPELQADVYRRLADLYDTNLPNPERAELAYREVLRRAPDDSRTVERLIQVLARLGRKEDAIQLSHEFLEKSASPEQRRERTADYATVLERIGGDKKLAEAVLERARREAPHDARLMRTLVELRRRTGDDNLARAVLERAASDARRALGTGRFEMAFFETLAAVAELRGQTDAARIAQSTLAALAGTDLPLVGAGPAAGARDLDDLLAPELLDPRIRKLIERTGAFLDKAYPVDLRALRATPLPPGSLAYFAHAQKVAESFGLDSIEILVSPSVGMNVVPLSSLPARLLIGPDLLKSSDDAVRFALLIRALKVLEVRAPVIARTSPVELVPLFGGLISSLVPDGALQPGVDARKARDAAERIGPALSPEVIEELAPLAREIAPLVSTRSSQIGTAVLQWASRTALLAAGDLHTLLTAVSRAAGGATQLPPTGPERLRFIVRNAEARDVSIFSVSDHYAEARKRLELA